MENYFETKLAEILSVLKSSDDGMCSEGIYEDERVTVIEEANLNTYDVFKVALAHLVDRGDVTLADGVYYYNETDAEYQEYLNGLSAESRANVERMNAKTGEQLYEMVDERTEDDEVNHPAHYTEGREHEPIDVIEDWELPYHLGNTVKYISRAGRKGLDLPAELKDLKKAAWYLDRYIALREAGK
jgi:hypothetical protein